MTYEETASQMRSDTREAIENGSEPGTARVELAAALDALDEHDPADVYADWTAGAFAPQS
jgi:hypothetical protein